MRLGRTKKIFVSVSIICCSTLFMQAQDTAEREKLEQRLKQLQENFEKQQREMRESFERMLRQQQEQIELLKKQIELLAKSQEYRCCPAGEAEPA